MMNMKLCTLLAVCIFSYFHTSTVAYCGEAAAPEPPPIRVAYNYCTLSYTFAYYSDAEWDAEIDRLAKAGYNAALVIDGTFKVWQATLRELGCDENTIAEFIPDECARAWWLMGNLYGEGGPLDQATIDADGARGRRICAKMREKGIEPILQGFFGMWVDDKTGSVKVEGLKIIPQGRWQCYARPPVIDPTCPAFARIAATWYRNLEAVYGFKPKYLAGDLFHEGGRSNGVDVTAAARAVQTAQQDAFPGVTWVVQAWGRNPTPALRAGLDPKLTLIEALVPQMNVFHKDDSTFDREWGEFKWVWCEVLNFGGKHGLHGNLKTFARLGRAAKGKGAKTFRGYGALSEGFFTNPVCYDLFDEMMMRPAGGEMTDAELAAWLDNWVDKRYGLTNSQLATPNSQLHQAWRILADTVYACPRDHGGPFENLMCAKPAWDVKRASSWAPKAGPWYDNAKLKEALDLMTAAFAECKSPNLALDVYDVKRQVSANRFRELLPRLKTGDAAARRECEDIFASICSGADNIASVPPEFRLATYEERARKRAGERGAKAWRRMITSWSDDAKFGRSSLAEYAEREYAELMRDYYIPRWRAFLANPASDRKPASDQDYEMGGDESAALLPVIPQPTEWKPGGGRMRPRGGEGNPPWEHFAALADSLTEPDGVKSTHVRKLAVKFSFGGENGEEFLMDGKPFQIRGGELMPQRIPREYWRHRVKMCKAMGLNTVSCYFAWNDFERPDGSFDFKTGSRDVAAFLNICREEGMWVLFRPGPYICAEWDFGGLPPRLLKDGILVRTTDPRYLAEAMKYLSAIADVAEPFLARNGGPIILTQIENEYGSWPYKDIAYVRQIKDFWKSRGFGPFYMADGYSDNHLKDLPYPDKEVAVGFDPAKNEGTWNQARKFNPGVPFLSAETYPGWLRHWGEGDWKPTDISGTIKWLMEKRRSFSLFVAHGGTSFGFTAGANDAGREDGYQPDLTSYDYGAPIDEQGRPRKEYFAYRDIIFKALGEEPPAVPGEIRAIGFPATVPRRFANLRSGLVQERAFETPPSFEELGQNQGIVFYRTTLPAGDTATLWFEKIADYAQIYIDGRRVATADRRNGKPFVSVPERDRPVELEIVVEAMGHINFGKGMMFDRKGIVGDVRLGGIVLKNWRVAAKPLAEESIVRAESTEKDAFAGGHFSATVVMDEIADTYIDMSKWDKGTLYVNGHNLGRYWKIGPQLSLYCPAPFLKKGENRIDIVELELSEPQPIRGLAQPIASQSKQNTRNTANEW